MRKKECILGNHTKAIKTTCHASGFLPTYMQNVLLVTFPSAATVSDS